MWQESQQLRLAGVAQPPQPPAARHTAPTHSKRQLK